MKKLFILIVSILIIYVIYMDLTVGTLPDQTQQAGTETVNQPETNMGIPAFKAKVEPGQTVISIVEHHINKALPVSIQDLIKDFKSLNHGISPENIQTGSSYFFPDYSNR